MNHCESSIRISNKGPYHSNKRDEFTNADFTPPSNEKNKLELSEIECFQCADMMDFFKKQYVKQLIYIKDQQKKIVNLQDENDKLDLLNQHLQNDIIQLNSESDEKDSKIKELNNKIRRIKRLIK